MMNERILELALEADHYADAMDIGGKNYIGLRDLHFARLIIQECLSYAKEGDIDFMKFMIKKHFGVE